MKISIITVCYNSEKTIKDTFESVLAQSYDNYEYVVIDGKSSDNTLKIIKEYEPKFKGKMKYISEKDNGLYDAMNKGIHMSTGDIVGIINSDDIIHDKDTFEKVVNTFEKDKCDVVYSDLYMLEETMHKVKRAFIAGKGSYKRGWHPPHPTMYIKKEIYNKYGTYNIDYKIAADYDFMLRIMKNNIKMTYIREPLIYMRLGGVSTKSFKAYRKSFKETISVLKHNEIRFPHFVNVLRTLKTFNQKIRILFIKKPN